MTFVTAITRACGKPRGAGKRPDRYLVYLVPHECWLTWQSFLLVLQLALDAHRNPHNRWSSPADWPFIDEWRRSHKRISRLRQEIVLSGCLIDPITNDKQVENPANWQGRYRWNGVPEIDPRCADLPGLPPNLKTRIEALCGPTGTVHV